MKLTGNWTNDCAELIWKDEFKIWNLHWQTGTWLEQAVLELAQQADALGIGSSHNRRSDRRQRRNGRTGVGGSGRERDDDADGRMRRIQRWLFTMDEKNGSGGNGRLTARIDF